MQTKPPLKRSTGKMAFRLVVAILLCAAAVNESNASTLAGPWPVHSPGLGVICFYYRIRNFAIRGFNAELHRVFSPLECAQLCSARPWCNSLEFSQHGQCFLSRQDIYTPETIHKWNTALLWDYWQLQDCKRLSGHATAPLLSSDTLPQPDDAESDDPIALDADELEGESLGRGQGRLRHASSAITSASAGISDGDQGFENQETNRGEEILPPAQQ